ncbi:MAG: glycosyltransferase [Chloroflexi bacterium]|nr:glycosyltransferase [Chloroflexota bacterium]
MISIIVPAHNARDHIGNCLSALLQQDGLQDDYEVIVVDDGSTDGTEDLARGYGVRILSQAHRGPGAARNYGASQAKGSLLLFTDADCEPAVDWATRMAKAFAQPEVIGAKGAYRCRQKGLVARFVQVEFEDKYDHLRKSEYIDFVDTYSAGYRREVLLAGGGFDPRFLRASVEDIDLSFRLAKNGCKMVFVQDAIVYHRHPATLREYARRKFWFGYWRVVIYRRFPGKALADSRTPLSLRVQVTLAGLLVPAILASIATTWLLAPAIFMLFMVSTVPFTIKALCKDRAIGLIAPFMLLTRALALGVGLAAGTIGTLKRGGNV